MEDKYLNKHSLEIPLYLNQKIVFDLLASINDGFTQVTKLKTTSATEGNLGGTIEADLGNKNIFALLGVKLKGKADVGHNREDNKEQEEIHTPSSLFNNLKDRLFKEKMVKSQPVLALLVFLFYFQLTFSLRIGKIDFDKLYVCFRSSAG